MNSINNEFNSQHMIYQQADKLLYEAKRNGRNQVRYQVNS